VSSTDTLKALSEAGVSIWLDDLSRQRINSGNLATLIRGWYVVGVTSNPTIFAHAVVHAEDYAEQVKQLAARGASVDEAVREITVADVQQACDVFSGTWEVTGGVDGRVSLEVSPQLAHDTDATLAQAGELWKLVDRPNVMIKIPATVECLPAITGALADGISVNVTLVFSVARHREVMAAFFTGLEQASANGYDVARIASVASFFVSRVDTEVDKRLEAIGTEKALALRGQAAVANARLAYAAYQQEFWHAALGPAEAGWGTAPAAAVGFHRGEEPRLPGHQVRHRTDRSRSSQHNAGKHPARSGRPRHGARRPGVGHRRGGPAHLR